MQPWKPLLAILPAGLLLGLVAGKATRPVMLIEDDRPWPQSVREDARDAGLWQPTYDDGGYEHYPRGYSYRPDLDYELYAWPDQADRSAELLAAEYDYSSGAADAARAGDEIDLPQTRRAVAELAGEQAERLAIQAAGIDDQASDGAPNAPAVGERQAFVLPPVPPPLAQAGAAPEPVAADEAEAY